MFTAITKFELRFHLKERLFYVLFALFFLLTFGAVASDAVTLGGAIGNVNRNSPYVIMFFMLVMCTFGILTTTAFVANSVLRDAELGIDQLFYTTRVSKWQYLLGRFTGSLIVSVLLFFGVSSAVFVGSLMPWIEKERLGPIMPSAYAFSFLALIVPNLLLMAAIAFAIAALSRSLVATWSGMVAFLAAWGVSSTMLANIENERLAAMLDPFGFGAFSIATRYWTVFDKNTKLLPLEGVFLMNRLAWMALALMIFAGAAALFSFTTGTRKSRKRAAGRVQEPVLVGRQLVLPPVHPIFGTKASWSQFFNSLRLELAMVFKSIPFWIILAIGILNLWGNSTAMEELFGAPVYPVSNLMVDLVEGTFIIYGLIIAGFYAGDIVWRERTLKLSEVYDAMPQKTWVAWGAKLAALVAVIWFMLAVSAVECMVLQALRGYYNFEPLVYVKGLSAGLGLFLLMMAGLAFALQVFFNQKFVGFAGVIVFFVLSRVMPAADLEHRLYRPLSRVRPILSDMNGFGHYLQPMTWFSVYWMIFVAILIVFAHVLWVRGTDGGFRTRMKIARQRFAGPVLATLALLVVGFGATGCYIYYNTNVLNRYRTTKEREKLQAEAEKKYKKYQGLAQPRITDAQADVDIYPDRRAVDIRGHYALVNKTAQPISDLHVTYNPAFTTFDVTIPGAKVKSDDADSGYRIYTLAQPLAPGASTTMTFHTGWAANGFPNDNSNTNIVENGTFVNSFNYFPHLGYSEGNELQDRGKRKKYGLAPIQRLAPPTDMVARETTGIRDADWIDLDTTVSTSADQIALAPGYLQKEWMANGRRYFRYKTTSPILPFWAYLSARYTVKRDQWNGIPIEIYYDAKHPYNVDRMIHAVKQSLDYFTKNFGPYQHRQIRILEFPRYERFAQSLPNTIPFSESIGFVADFRDEADIDYAFYVTAHEVAHQWWAHQVIGGNVQGSTMLVETMAQYSALMVQEKEYGRDKMKKFLRFELDRYLAGRGGELVAEMPLSLVENQQYIHYRKGSMVMYALRDAIGEDHVNAALAKFIRDHKFENPPYTTATELVKYFRAEAPPQYQNLITDLFERITLFDLVAENVKSVKRADGKYDVTMTVTAKKLYGDAKGQEKETKIDDWIDVGVLAKNSNPKKKDEDRVLVLEKRHITQPKETFQFVVNEEPNKAGIDPLNKMIDRNPRDNTKSF